jgi:hypothetical protein
MTGWKHGSSGRVPAKQEQGPEFKLQYHQKKKKRKEKGMIKLTAALLK